MPTRLYFSNDIETLAAAFMRELSARPDWFTPCTVIVPNPYLRKWLQLRIAERCGIAINLDFRFLNDGLWKLAGALLPGPDVPSMIDPLDLQLMLHHALSSLGAGDPTAAPIMEYLHAPGGEKKTGYDHRISQLSSRLCRYFLEYELYREDMIRSWMRGKLLLNTPMEAAQRHLYRAVFEKGGLRDAVNRNLLTLPQFWSRLSPLADAPVSGKLHLFGKSQLSPFHARMLYELGKRLNISLYQLNPCSEFWEDVTTPREDRWRRIRSIRIEETAEGKKLAYDENENPLLKLWGKTGRETIKLLSLLEEAGSAGAGFQSEWFEPEAPPAATCLAAVREQILKRTTRTSPDGAMPQDTSIQIASCSEIFREAEAVYNSILHNLEHDPGCAMTDIAVMVPDMAAYGPVLHSVFSREPKRLSYSMIDSTAATDSLFGQGIASLLKIAAGSFTRAEVFGLVYNRCFLAAHDMTLEDADAWLAWADALQVFNGFCKNDDPDPRGNPHTWQQALQRIRMGRIMNPDEGDAGDGTFLDYRHVVPYADMKTADQGLVDSFNRVIELLHARTRRLRSLSATGTEWAHTIEVLASDFLAIPEDRPEEAAVRQKLMNDMERLARADALLAPGPGALYSLAFIREFIAQTLAGIPSAHGSYLVSGINISAMVPKRQVPFKIIYLMGMQEGIFPGVVDSSTLNLISRSRMIGDVTRPDANRYLFLETLLSARDRIYITYVNKDLQKDKAYYPNSVIGQLITYLEATVIKKKFAIADVPPSGSSDRYLLPVSGDSSFSDFIVSCRGRSRRPVNYSESDLLVLYRNAARDMSAASLPSAIKEALSKQIPDFTVPPPDAVDQIEAEALTLNDLATFLIDPIESALRWHLGLHEGDDDDRSIEEDEPFFTKYPHTYRFIADALDYHVRAGAGEEIASYLHDYYEHAALKSITPDGAFRDIDYDNYLALIEERLGAAGITAFLQARRRCSFYRNVTFGVNRMRVKPGLLFPPLRFAAGSGSRAARVELSGSAPFIWKDPGTGGSETLVITGSGKPAITHLVRPFLFYMAAASGFDTDLRDFIGTAPFTVHVAHRAGIAAYPCHASERDAAAYCERLAAGFLDGGSFDLLPLAIVAEARSALPHEMKDRPDPAEEHRYRGLLARLIDDDADRAWPAYRPMDILQLLDARVPDDAYARARDRLGPLFRSFMEGSSS